MFPPPSHYRIVVLHVVYVYVYDYYPYHRIVSHASPLGVNRVYILTSILIVNLPILAAVHYLHIDLYSVLLLLMLFQTGSEI